MEGVFTKTIEGLGGLVVKGWPLEKGVPLSWSVRVTKVGLALFLFFFFLEIQHLMFVKTDGCLPSGPLFSASVVTEQEVDTDWPCWGACHGWGIAFWEEWEESVFSHDGKQVAGQSMKVHRVEVDDLIEVSLSEFGDLSFSLNGEKMGTYPSRLEFKEALYPAAFAMGHGGLVGVEIQIDSALNIKPAKR